MPGLVRIISHRPPPESEQDLHRMVGSMIHEPFYVSGEYACPELGLYLGWVTHKGSFSDCLPVWNEKRDVLLFFCGEDFPDSTLRLWLREKGHEGDLSDARYLVHLYEEKGISFLTRLNGWFSGFLVDFRRSDGFLFIDRFGMQRIYYCEGEKEVLFASEAKAILKVRPECRELDPVALGEYLGCGCTLNNKSVFKGVKLLPGASLWRFSGGQVRKDRFFDPADWERQPVIEPDIFFDKFKQAFLNALPRYFVSREPIALSSTAGLDTRMILAAMDRPPGSLPFYTFGSMYRESYDVRISRRLASLCHQPYHVLRLDGRFLSGFPEYAGKTVYVTDGCHDACGSYEYYLNRLAREIAPIRMTGDFGGEVLRGVSHFKADDVPQGLFCTEIQALIHQGKATLTENRRKHPISFAVFNEAPWSMYGCFAAEQSQLTLRSPYLDNDLVGLMYRAPPAVRRSEDLTLRFIREYSPSLFRVRTDRGAGGEFEGMTLPTRLFREFLFKAEYYSSHGAPRWLTVMDRRLKPLNLETLFLGRHKFYHYRKWLRDDLASYVREILLDRKTLDRPHFEKRGVEKIVEAHTNGTGNHAAEINKVLTLELICRHLTDA